LVPSKEVEQSVILGGEETFLLLIGLVRWEGWITLSPPPTHNIQTSKKLRPGRGRDSNRKRLNLCDSLHGPLGAIK